MSNKNLMNANNPMNAEIGLSNFKTSLFNLTKQSSVNPTLTCQLFWFLNFWNVVSLHNYCDINFNIKKWINVRKLGKFFVKLQEKIIILLSYLDGSEQITV